MRVDETRNEHVLGQLDVLVIREFLESFCPGEKLLDTAIAHGDGLVLEDRARRLDRYDPAGAEE
jgi:hypothetical protein